MKKLIGCAIVGCLALAPVCTWAKPVLWFHFNEKPCGGHCQKGDQTITNAATIVGAAELNGTVKGVQWNTVAPDDWGALYLTYTNAIDVTTTWIDPKTGEKGDTRGAYFHSSADYEKPMSTSGTGRAVSVLVPDNEKLHLDKFTVEFFMRRNTAIAYASQVLPLQLYNSSSNTVAWQILFSSCEAGKVAGPNYIGIFGCKSDGTGAFHSGSLETPFPIYDGAWHHIAATYDGSAKKIKLYADYRLVGEVTATIEYAENVADALLSVGNASRSKDSRYHGFVDELRICDEVLEPRQFLRAIPVLCDKDTLAYISFERFGRGKADFGYYGMTNNVNEVFPLGAPKFPLNEKRGATLESTFLTALSNPAQPIVTNEVPAVAIRNGLHAESAVTNAGSLAFTENSYYLTVDDNSDGSFHTILTNDAYTVEWFFRKKSGDANRVYLLSSFMQEKTGDPNYSAIMLMDGNSELCAYVATTNITDAGNHQCVGEGNLCVHPSWGEKSIGNVGDGKWHHLAFVGDRGKRICSIYMDYQPIWTFTNCVIMANKYASAYVQGLTVGGSYNKSSNFRGFIDELRVTRRALTPREFLSMNGECELGRVNSKKVLLYAPFDDFLNAYPFKDVFGAYTLSNVGLGTDVPRRQLATRSLMGLSTENKKSLSTASGESGNFRFDTPVCLYGLDAFTIEWYANLSNPGSSQPIIYFEGKIPSKRADQWPHSFEYNTFWQICGDVNALHTLMFKAINDYAGASESHMYWTAPEFRHNCWHHYALTCRKVEVEGVAKLECHFYVNHREANRTWAENPYIDVPELLWGSKCYLRIGSADWCDFSGAFDELRITEGVLTTDEMMPAIINGSVLFIR